MCAAVVIFVMSVLADPAEAASSPAKARNVVSIGDLDIEGGGMVDVQGNIAANWSYVPAPGNNHPGCCRSGKTKDTLEDQGQGRYPLAQGTHLRNNVDHQR